MISQNQMSEIQTKRYCDFFFVSCCSLTLVAKWLCVVVFSRILWFYVEFVECAIDLLGKSFWLNKCSQTINSIQNNLREVLFLFHSRILHKVLANRHQTNINLLSKYEIQIIPKILGIIVYIRNNLIFAQHNIHKNW